MPLCVPQALADGNKVWGVVSTASNSDGRACSPITAPSHRIQAQLIRTAMRNACVTPDMLQYAEMHGEGALRVISSVLIDHMPMITSSILCKPCFICNLSFIIQPLVTHLTTN